MRLDIHENGSMTFASTEMHYIGLNISMLINVEELTQLYCEFAWNDKHVYLVHCCLVMVSKVYLSYLTC